MVVFDMRNLDPEDYSPLNAVFNVNGPLSPPVRQHTVSAQGSQVSQPPYDHK